LRIARLIVASTAALLLAACSQPPFRPDMLGGPAPRYSVDPYWPKPLPNAWTLGQVAGISIDQAGLVWVLHRPGTVAEDEKGASYTPPRAKCCTPAPPVLVFDAEGNLVRSWGGPGAGYDWPQNEHGIYVDPSGYVWVGGNGLKDQHVLKFTNEGRFLLQIGKPGVSGGSNATDQLGRPASMEVDPKANELYIADGYGNKRVIVFDATTGRYKRHWGAYGRRPDDAKMPTHDTESPQFANPVHCVRLAFDELVYVCDRTNNRIQVFRKDGTFVRQYAIEPQTRINGSVHDMILSTDLAQSYLFVGDGSNSEVHIIHRPTGQKLWSFGRMGRLAGEFYGLHNLAIDAGGNLYTGEVRTGKRVQKFVRVSGGAPR
jgi:DNA-binding beta-propeller fold protein YncE